MLFQVAGYVRPSFSIVDADHDRGHRPQFFENLLEHRELHVADLAPGREEHDHEGFATHQIFRLQQGAVVAFDREVRHGTIVHAYEAHALEIERFARGSRLVVERGGAAQTQRVLEGCFQFCSLGYGLGPHGSGGGRGRASNATEDQKSECRAESGHPFNVYWARPARTMRPRVL
jgi:hypothetical protein